MKGFRDFILRGNVIDLAVAVVIGTAFTAIVTPDPSKPVHADPLPVRTDVAAVDCSSRLAVRAVIRFGEMLCTSPRAAIVCTAPAGSRTDNARTET